MTPPSIDLGPAGRPGDGDPAPQSSHTPHPASSSELLYEQGMSHYQRREWRQALEYFRRLRSVDPNWPGIDPLIDELSWFLQLEQVETGSDRTDSVAGADGGRSRSGAQQSRRARSIGWLSLLGLTGVALLALAWWQGWFPGIETRLQREALYNRGQAGLAAGDYGAAREAFAELAQLAPDNPAAQEGLARAASLEQLTLAYEAAQAAIEQQDWETAKSSLQQVLATDPAYADASELLSRVERQQEASALFIAGVAAYDQGQWSEAIQQLERLAEMDATHERDAVRELLFVLYLRDGEELLATSEASPDTIRQAIGRFGKALALRPRNIQAADESRLANQYLLAREALNRQDQRQAEDALRAIVQERADYAGGQAAQLYFDLLVRQGKQAAGTGDATTARTAFEAALVLDVADPSEARTALQALAPEATPTLAATPQPAPFVEPLADTVNVRLGPGTDFPLLGQMTAGTRLGLIGRNEAGDWLVVCCIDERPGWVAARLVRTDTDIATLPVGLSPTLPPPPTLAATATQVLTPAPTPTAAALVVPATPTPVPEPSDAGNDDPPPEPTDTPEPR